MQIPANEYAKSEDIDAISYNIKNNIDVTGFADKINTLMNRLVEKSELKSANEDAEAAEKLNKLIPILYATAAEFFIYHNRNSSRLAREQRGRRCCNCSNQNCDRYINKNCKILLMLAHHAVSLKHKLSKVDRFVAAYSTLLFEAFTS